MTGVGLLMAVVLAAPGSAQGVVSGGGAFAGKSERAALTWSLAATALPVVTGGLLTAGYLIVGESQGGEAIGLYPAITGVVVGPALGHFYAARSGRAVGGIFLRIGILGATAVAVVAACVEDCTPAQERDAAIRLLLGSGLAVTSAVFDIVAAPGSARRYNASRMAVSIAPFVAPDGRGVGVVALIRY